jgi:hypothetical protein
VKLLHLFLPSVAREAYAVLREERIDALRATLTGELGGWLRAVKHHLEAIRRGTAEAPAPGPAR